MGRDLAQQVRQHRRIADIADVAPGDFDRPNLQRFLVDPEVDLAPNAPFRTAMLACIPLAFTFDLDPGAVDHPLCQGCCPLLYFISNFQVGGIGR